MAKEGPLPKIPGFEILERLATGGRAEILLARDSRRGGELVALKLLLEKDLGRADRIRDFADEVKISCRLEHPTIVRVFEGEVASGRPYLVMELVDGITLWELCVRARRAKKRIPYGLAAYLCAMVADALAYAHELEGPNGEPLNVVHRDVSTVNVMVTFDGAVKLLDFGIARSRIKSELTKPGIIKGKLDYLSPEQCRSGTIDAKTDIYALGVVLFELITGVRPFSDDVIAVLFDKVCAGDRPTVRSLRPDVPPRLENIVDKAMQVDPARRFESAAKMHDALRAFMDRLPSRPTSTTLAEFIADVAPDEVGRVQDIYGAPDTTDVTTVEEQGAPPPPPKGSKQAEPADGGAPRPAEAARVASPPTKGSTRAEPADGRDPRPVEAPHVESPPPKGNEPGAASSHAPVAGASSQTSPPPAAASHLDEASPPQRASPRLVLPLFAAMILCALLSGICAVRLARGPGEPPRRAPDGAVATAERSPAPDPAIEHPTAPPPPVEPAPDPDLDFADEAPLAPSTDAGGAHAAARADAGLERSQAAQGAEDTGAGDDAGMLDFGDRFDAGDATADQGWLTVTTRRRANVFLRGRQIGTTPLERYALPPGRYRVKVRGRYGVRREWVTIRAGSEETLRFNL